MSLLWRWGAFLRAFILTMQLSVILLLATALQVSAASVGSAQSTVSFTGKDVPLEQVFASVKKQTGYTFVYYTEVLKGAHAVTLDVKNMPVEAFLDACLKDEPLTYKVVGQTVMIGRKEGKSPLSEGDNLSAPDIRGRVTNNTGEPLAGASVVVKGTKKGTTTGSDGSFSLKGVSPGMVLVVTYAGFGPKEVKAEINGSLIVVLQPSNNPLDQVQVIAYGTTTERLSTGDVTIVRAADIEKQPINNPLLALEGRVPGLVITQATGFAGSGISVLIRGQNSIQSGNDPFYVIDGVPYISQLLPNLGSGLLGNSGVTGNTQGGNPLSYLNPSDIESISVLKDADATAIYGSRAANGAILITTKKGKTGATTLDINGQSGWGQVTRKLNLLNTQQYLSMRHDALENDGLTPSTTDYDLNGTWDTTRSTDWQRTLIGNTAQYSNINGSVSGGSINTHYLVGGTYHRETLVIPGNFADVKGSLHFAINAASTDQKFQMQFTGSYLIDDNHLPAGDLTNTAMKLAPDAPALYNPDGSLNWQQSSGASTWSNPLAGLYNSYSIKANNLVSNLTLAYQFLPGFYLRSSLGYTNLQTNEIITGPLVAFAPESRATSQRSAVFGNNNINSWVVEPQAEYKSAFGRSKIDVLAGTTFEQTNSNGLQLSASGFNSDAVLDDIHSASSVSVAGTTANIYKYDAGFARVSYNWDDKYLVNFSGRRDGSSRFGPANKFHDFGALGVGWIFSQEDFVKDKAPILSFGKIKASYGTTGNDQIGDYQFLSLYSPTSASVPYQGITGLAPTGLTNPYLQWESTKKLSVGLDLGLLHDRAVLNTTYYVDQSSNQLLGYALPIITGASSITKNFPATVRNSGWEFSLSTTNLRSKDFSWSTNINLTIPRNKLVAFPNLASSSYASTLVIGKPVSILHLYHMTGVDPASGIYEFGDGHGQISNIPDTNYQTSRSVLGELTPKFYGGLGNTFRYKGLELDVFLQFLKQKAINYFFGSLPGFVGTNQPTTVLDAWRKPGDIAPVQRYNSDFSLAESYVDAIGSDGAFKDASFIRVKNISLSWQLPVTWKNKIHMRSADLYIQAQNLFTFTRYKGLDPETLNSTSLPPLRVLTIGTHLNL